MSWPGTRALASALIILFGFLLKVQAEPSIGGIVYGPKGAFKIDAPQGWVLDNSAGKEQGLPCVLHPKGTTWEETDVLMYAKIAGTSVTDYESFAKDAIAHAKKQRGEFTPKQVEKGKTGGGQPYFINEYPANEQYTRFERVAYVQMPNAVAFIVYSAVEEKDFRKHQNALNEVLKSFVSMDVEKK